MGECFHCHKEIQLPQGPVGRGETCPSCGSDVRVCKNCGHYDVASYNECREIQADRVVDKERANYCDYFTFVGGSAKQQDDREAALKKLNDLFK